MWRNRILLAGLAYLVLVLPAAAEKRIALVIGNSGYQHATPLPNPVNDASDVAAALKEVGFQVIVGLDLGKSGFDGKVREFARALDGADTALLFYAGHGLQVSGQNFLVPTDAKLEGERDLDFEAVSLDFVLRQMEIGRESKTNIVFLDACRDNPLARNLARNMGTRSTNVGRGLAHVQTGVGTFISYSTQPGNVAVDGVGRNSPFSGALVKGIALEGRNLSSVMFDVRKEVLNATSGKQVPWDHSALTSDFFFHLASAGGTLPKTAPARPNVADDETLQRLRQLEEELKKKNDPQNTARMVALSQAKARIQQLEDDNRQDQQRIFDTYRKYPAHDTASRATASREVGNIQMSMSRRGGELHKLRREVKELEQELGLDTAAKQ